MQARKVFLGIGWPEIAPMKCLPVFMLLALGLVSDEPRRRRTPYFDVEFLYEGRKQAGRLIFDLYWDTAPRTAENFSRLAEGVPIDGEYRCYTGNTFHRVIRDFVIQGGDVVKQNGTGSTSIYGDTFEDESFALGHDSAGKLSMANRGPNTNGSQFFITLEEKSFLDGKHVVFGEVRSECMEIVMQISRVPVDYLHKPIEDIRITRSGILEDEEHKEL
jgi:cyclophilin family peptidyl-prolyl cis-trans isomerase